LIENFKNIKPHSSEKVVVRLISFLEKELPQFTLSEAYKKNYQKAFYHNEKQCSSAIAVFISKYRNGYSCIPEINQRGTSSGDLGFYFNNDLIFIVEAKVLPTPLTHARNEFEYVHGKGAGIERFKQGLHGIDFQHKDLRVNGMFAYIKNNEFLYWFKKVNQWILDAKWDNSEILRKGYFSSIAKLKSTHIRIKSGEQVVLHHFWIKIS
jgi:hypothetical protein